MVEKNSRGSRSVTRERGGENVEIQISLLIAVHGGARVWPGTSRGDGQSLFDAPQRFKMRFDALFVDSADAHGKLLKIILRAVEDALVAKARVLDRLHGTR
jgi:hypothetical protein